jgi:hypothetical protein
MCGILAVKSIDTDGKAMLTYGHDKIAVTSAGNPAAGRTDQTYQVVPAEVFDIPGIVANGELKTTTPRGVVVTFTLNGDKLTSAYTFNGRSNVGTWTK